MNEGIGIMVTVPRIAYGEFIGSPKTPGKPGWTVDEMLEDLRTFDAVTMRCYCGERSTLFFCHNGHRIDEHGIVAPAIICPHGCGWHVWIQLAEWPGVTLP